MDFICSLIPMSYALEQAPVVQMDRTVDSGSAGCAFESRRARPNSAQISDLTAELRTPHLCISAGCLPEVQRIAK
jgi:hypothetical protein